jgi:succinyl-diaminopimelate desuccinylase
MINKLKKTIEEVTGNKSELQTNHGASDLAFASEKGIESAIFGPYGLNYHGKNEFVYIDSLKLYYEVMKEFISKL